MMQKLLEAYEQGNIKIGDYVNYQPDYRQEILTREETGWSKNQVVGTEKDLRYQFAGINKGKILILADTVSSKVILQGKNGYENGPRTLQKYVEECYSSKKLNAKGVCITKEIFVELPIEIRENNYTYWLATQCRYMCIDRVFFGVHFVLGENVYRCGLYYSSASTNKSSNGIRPAIILPDDIQIDENNNLVYM